jgi:hypothetical protein
MRTFPHSGPGRVEDEHGSFGHAATLRFSSPLIESDVPVSGIRLRLASPLFDQLIGALFLSKDIAMRF